MPDKTSFFNFRITNIGKLVIMKKLLIVVMIVSFPSLVLAQNTTFEKDTYQYQKGTLSFDQWSYIGLSSAFYYNFVSISDAVMIPSAGTTAFVPTPGAAICLTVRKDFSSKWSSSLGLGYGSYGFRIATKYPMRGKGSSGFSEGQWQLASYFQYNIFGLSDQSHLKTTHIFTRLGLLTNIHPVQYTSNSVATFSRRYKDETKYIDQIYIDNKFWVKTGLLVGIGVDHQIESGFVFGIAAVYYLGFSELTNFTYNVSINDHVNPNKTLLRTAISNKGSFVGITLDIYLPPFGYRKLGK